MWNFLTKLIWLFLLANPMLTDSDGEILEPTVKVCCNDVNILDESLPDEDDRSIIGYRHCYMYHKHPLNTKYVYSINRIP